MVFNHSRLLRCGSGVGGTREAGDKCCGKPVNVIGCRSTRKRNVALSIRGVKTRFDEGGGELDPR